MITDILVTLSQLSPIVAITVIIAAIIFSFIKLIEWLVPKKGTPKISDGQDISLYLEQIMTILKKQNDNHLHSIQEAITNGNKDIMENSQRQTDRMCEKMDRMIEGIGRLDGRMSIRS